MGIAFKSSESRFGPQERNGFLQKSAEEFINSAGLLVSEIRTFFLPLAAEVKWSFTQCEGIRVFLLQRKAMVTHEKALLKKKVGVWMAGKVVQALQPSSLPAIAHQLKEICCSCAAHTQRCSTALYTAFTGSCTRSAVFPLLQPFLGSKTALSARKDAKTHVSLPISMLIAIIKLATGLAGMTETSSNARGWQFSLLR